MNAAGALAATLPRAALRRLAPGVPDDDRAGAVARAFAFDLCGLLNRLRADELRAAAAAARLPVAGDALALRLALWRWGAVAEAGGEGWLGTPLQPVPVPVGARLVHAAPARGLAPPASTWPRPLPPPRPAAPPSEEPDDVDALLAAADRALGVRLPARGRDKGAWGAAAAALLGVRERGHDEPDWRGDVELKTVPVTPDRHGRWRVTEDPAVAMVDGAPLAKLRRVLWLVRAAVGDGATLLSWYLLEWDADVARLVRRDLHTRPKGPRGTAARGWYLHKRFFVDAGLYATLNGP
ncbi:MAG: hypothetical protein KJZ91_29945 [Myxococcales bacterium]|nr:hypothetical protein [Myxococcales bacterium]